MRRWCTAAVAFTVLLGAAFVSAGDRPAPAAAGYEWASSGSYDFDLSVESVSELSPGKMKYLRVSARNPYGFPITVVSVRGTAVASSRRNCQATHNLAVWRFTGPLPQSLGAHRSRVVGALPVSMPAHAAGTCPDTTFTIKVTGTAVRAR